MERHTWDVKYRDIHREKIREKSRLWMKNKRRSMGILPRGESKIIPKSVLHQKVHELKGLGFNSFQVSRELKVSLSVVNKLYATSISNPNSKKLWSENRILG